VGRPFFWAPTNISAGPIRSIRWISWTPTSSKPHHRRKRLYSVDGEWRKMKLRPVLLKVKLSGLLTVPVPKMTYWSDYGATVRSKDGEFFAIRMGRQPEGEHH
jgi:hypothetical protein